MLFAYGLIDCVAVVINFLRQLPHVGLSTHDTVQLIKS